MSEYRETEICQKFFSVLFSLNKASLSNGDIWSMLILCLCFKDLFFLEFETHQVERTDQNLSHTQSQTLWPWLGIYFRDELWPIL